MEENLGGSAPQTPMVSSTPEMSAPAAPPPMASAAPTATFSATPASEKFDALGYVKSHAVELGFMILAACGLIYTIRYYRYKMKEDKLVNSDLHRRIDGLEKDVVSIKTDISQPAQPATFTGGFY